MQTDYEMKLAVASPFRIFDGLVSACYGFFDIKPMEIDFAGLTILTSLVLQWSGYSVPILIAIPCYSLN